MTAAVDMSPWFADHANLVILTAHLARHGHSAENIAEAVEKPWNYTDEFYTAKAILDHEFESGNDGHVVTYDPCRKLNYPDAGPADWYCTHWDCTWELVSA